MHAVILSVTIHDYDEATTYLRNEIVPRVKQAPGFVAGYWVSIADGDQGRGTIVFESEDAAQAVASQITQAPGDAETLNSASRGGRRKRPCVRLRLQTPRSDSNGEPPPGAIRGRAEAGDRTRTDDPFITSEVLYQLSYAGRSERF